MDIPRSAGVVEAVERHHLLVAVVVAGHRTAAGVAAMVVLVVLHHIHHPCSHCFATVPDHLLTAAAMEARFLLAAGRHCGLLRNLHHHGPGCSTEQGWKTVDGLPMALDRR